MKKLFFISALGVLLSVCCAHVFAQQDTTVKHVKGIFSHPKLQIYREAADEQFRNFKNRFALEALRHMDAAADTLFVAELQRTEEEMRKKRDADNREQTSKLGEQGALIKSLESQNEVLRSERNALWRKAVISIVIWLVMVTLFVIYRMRNLTKTNKVLEESRLSLQRGEKLFEKGNNLVQMAYANEAALKEADAITSRISSGLQEPANSAAGEQLVPVIQQVMKLIDANERILLLAKELPQDRQTVDVNVLCEQLVMLANGGIETEDGVYHFTITKDLEKKLPSVTVNEQGLARVLLFLLSNALNACYRQSKLVTKGYQPRITVSTRVLPRFVQVKVKDNGAGVIDAISDSVFDPYFTTEAGKKSGLGLTMAKKIIDENKGEIKIESALDRGTDVTIKLFTNGR